MRDSLYTLWTSTTAGGLGAGGRGLAAALTGWTAVSLSGTRGGWRNAGGRRRGEHGVSRGGVRGAAHAARTPGGDGGATPPPPPQPYSDEKRVGFRAGDGAHGAVTRRPPIPLDTMVPRTHMYTHAAEFWDLSIVHGPFSVTTPCQTLTVTIRNFLHRCTPQPPRCGAAAYAGWVFVTSSPLVFLLHGSLTPGASAHASRCRRHTQRWRRRRRSPWEQRRLREQRRLWRNSRGC